MATAADKKAKIGVLGASGYTGVGAGAAAAPPSAGRDRAAHRRPPRRAGDARRCFRSSRRSICRSSCRSTASTGPPPALDLIFCALPHATTQKVIKQICWQGCRTTKVVDLSADFRLADPAAYARWYGHEHHAPELQKAGGVRPGRGLSREDQARAARRQSRLLHHLRAACRSFRCCEAKAIEPDEIVIDAKSGMTGAGRAAKEEMLFSEVSEGFHAYGVGHHRHMAELDQEFSLAAGREVDGRASRRIWCR